MMRLTCSRPVVRRAVVSVGALALTVAVVAPASAAEPAGSGVEIVAASVSGSVLSWSGSYSCVAGLVDGVTVTAIDTDGDSGSETLPLVCVGDTAGGSISGQIDNGLLGLGGNWGSDITVTATLNGTLGRTLGTDQIAVQNNNTVETSLDSAVLNEDGSATLSGGFTCAQSGAPGTVSTTLADPANGTIWGTATVPVTCPVQVGAVGRWSATEKLNNSPDLAAAVTAATIPPSPAAGLIQSALNKPCIALPAKANVQSVLALVNVGVQDIPVLSSPQNQQCTENSVVAKGDEALSHILDNIPVLSGNVSAGS